MVKKKGRKEGEREKEREKENKEKEREKRQVFVSKPRTYTHNIGNVNSDSHSGK